MSEAVQLVLITTLINSAVTWGIVKTQLQWLRRDVDELREHRHVSLAGKL